MHCDQLPRSASVMKRIAMMAGDDKPPGSAHILVGSIGRQLPRDALKIDFGLKALVDASKAYLETPRT